MCNSSASGIDGFALIMDMVYPLFRITQETWMFGFQQEYANKISEGYESHSRSVDEEDHSLIQVLPRGFGGVTIMWDGSKHQPSTPIDGTSRIVVIQENDLVIISAYLPCRGSGYTNADYIEAIQQLSILCDKYSDSMMILAGDLNVDMEKQSDTRMIGRWLGSC